MSQRELERILSRIPTYSQELGLDLQKPADRFKWLLASILFAKRISAEVAKQTFRRFMEEKLTSLDEILQAGWDRLVEVLDSGGYVRYDFSTASTLLKFAEELKLMGGLEQIRREARNHRELERKLMRLRGVGPTAVNIFLRELRGIWSKAKPGPSKLAIEVARKLGLKRVEAFESALVRLKLEFCKRKRCCQCPVCSFCDSKASQSR